MADTWVDILTAEHEAAADPHPQYQLAVDLSFKKAVRAVATTNVASLSGTTTIDGVSLVADDRVLLVGQSTGSQNGVYTVAAGAWSRSSDLNTSAEFHPGVAVIVGEGTVGAGMIFYFATTGAFTLGSTSQTWTAVGSNYLALSGGTLTGSLTTRDVTVGSTYKLKFASDALIKGDTSGGLYLRNYADSDFASLRLMSLVADANLDAGPNAHIGFGGGGIRAMIKSNASDVILMRDAADTGYANLYCNNFYPQGSISIGTSNYYDISGRVRLYGYANGVGEFKNYDGSALAELRLADPSSDATAAITQGWLNTSWISGRTALTSGYDATNDYVVLYDASASTTKKVSWGNLTDHGGLQGLGDDDHTQYQLRSEKDAASGYQGLNSVGVANGSYANTYLSKISTYTVAAGDRGKVILMNTSGGNRTVNLLASATAAQGFVIGVKKATSDANTVTVDANSSELIDGAATHVLTAHNKVVWYMCDGTDWQIIGEGGAGSSGGISAALIARTVYTTGSAATHTVNGSAQMVRIICVGAGGGGGGAAQGGGQCGVSGGGGSGGITDYWWTPSGNITYTVGAFGAKGAAGNNAGTAGGDTTASGTGLSLTAKGGNGGLSMAFGTAHTAAPGGAVNAGTTGGDVNVTTGEGGTGIRQGGTLGIAGDGADCGNYGRGGAGGQVNTAGSNGTGYGSGGGGAHANGAGGVDKAGGDGAGGLIIIEEYY